MTETPEPTPEPTQRGPLAWDPENHLTGAGPAFLTCMPIDDGQGGQVLSVCVRTSSATVVVVLSRDDAMKWGHVIRQSAGRISSLSVARSMPQGPSSPLNGHQR